MYPKTRRKRSIPHNKTSKWKKLCKKTRRKKRKKKKGRATFATLRTATLHTTWWPVWQCAPQTTRNNTYLSWPTGKERRRRKAEKRGTRIRRESSSQEKRNERFSLFLSLYLPLSLSLSPSFGSLRVQLESIVREEWKDRKRGKAERRQSTIDVQMKIQITHAYVSGQ